MPFLEPQVQDVEPQSQLTIVNTTSRRFDDLSRRSIRSHAAAFGRRRQKEAKAKKLATQSTIRILAEKVHRLSPSPQIGSPLDPFSALPQSIVELNHGGSLDRIKDHLFFILRQPVARQVVVPEAVRHPTFFTSFLLLAYSHYDAMTSSKPSSEAISLKIENIRQINEQLQDPATAATPENICAIMCLSGATTAYEMDALWDYSVHRNAIAMLANLAGGPEVLKQTQLGYNMVRMMVLRDQIEYSTWSSPYRDFPKQILDPLPPFVSSTRQTGRIWKSPFYDPPVEQLGETSWGLNLNLGTRLILLNVKALMTLLKDEKHESLDKRAMYEESRSGIRKALNMALPISLTGKRDLGVQDYIYESCRLTTTIMLTAEATSCSFRIAVQNTTLLDELRHNLLHADISSLWGEHIGILFWVISIANAAAYHTPHHLYFTSILTNLMFELCFSDYDLEVALIPLETMSWFEEHCKSGKTVLAMR